MIKEYFVIFIGLLIVCSCNEEQEVYEEINTEISLNYPNYFPSFNLAFYENKPTKYGVVLGEKLFNEKRLSVNNSISCSSCHVKSKAFTDGKKVSVGVFGKKGFRNVPPLQNLAFQNVYMWDGIHLDIKDQVLVPIITPEEMGSSILDVIGKIKNDATYKDLFKKTFGDEQINGDRIFSSIVQYQYTLISANSKYDKVKRGELRFNEQEQKGLEIFNKKCVSCHSTQLFTDNTFRNIGFPVNKNPEESGRTRVTGDIRDYMAFKVPSLRNIEYTAPYGSAGQFSDLKSVLDYFDKGVVISENLDPILKKNGGKIPLTEKEKELLIVFLKTLTDYEFTKSST